MSSSSSTQDVLSSDQLSCDQTISNQLSQSQIDQQIEKSIDEAQLDREEDQTFIDETFVKESNTIDLSTPSQKLETNSFFNRNRKRKIEEEHQLLLRKKCDPNKIPTLVLTVNEALKNAQKTLFEGLKVAKTEHAVVQQLINQIERARVELGLTDKAPVVINQTHTTKHFQFESINLAKASKKTSSSTYCDTMSENFQELEKAMEKKMTTLINKRFDSQSNQSRISKVANVSKLENSNAKDSNQTLKSNQTIRKSQPIEISQTNALLNSSSTWTEVVSKNTQKTINKMSKSQTVKLNETIQ